jgi:sortase A
MREPARALEAVCWIAGIGLLLSYFSARTEAWHQQQQGLERFAATATQPAAEPPALTRAIAVPAPDRRLWSAERKRAYDAASSTTEVPVGVLRIPSIALAVPIYEGTGESSLDRGAGRIEGTAGLDEQGNIGLAAHRDGFFRSLKGLRLGDELTVQTMRATRVYRVVDLGVTSPGDREVIAPTSVATVTLVTCYPFYFVGSAPQRYIVRAELLAP